jgi:hypothetical protein
MWACEPAAAARCSILWCSELSVSSGTLRLFSFLPSSKTIPELNLVRRLLLLFVPGTIASYGLKKRAEPVKNCRKVSKKDMKHNSATPVMTGPSLSIVS